MGIAQADMVPSERTIFFVGLLVGFHVSLDSVVLQCSRPSGLGFRDTWMEQFALSLETLIQASGLGSLSKDVSPDAAQYLPKLRDHVGPLLRTCVFFDDPSISESECKRFKE